MGDSLGNRLRKAREVKGLTRRQLARLSGVSDSYLTLLEHDKRGKPSYSIAKKISDALGAPIEELFGGELDTISPPPDIVAMLRDLQSALEGTVLVRIPLLGVVPGGEPFTPLDSPLKYVLVPQSLIKGKHPYALKLSGTSLEGFGLHDGDTLTINPDDTEIIDGKIYIVRIGNSEVTAKKVYKDNDRLRLVGSNGSTEIMSPHRVECIGKVTGASHATEIE